jgi:hypothetical protein
MTTKLLREQEDNEAVAEGLREMEDGKGRPMNEVAAAIQKDFGLPPRQGDWKSVQRGLKDREQGNELPLAEADAKIRQELGFPPRA